MVEKRGQADLSNGRRAELDRAPNCSLEDLTKQDGSFGGLGMAFACYEVLRDR